MKMIVLGGVAAALLGATPVVAEPMVRIAELEIDPAQLDAYKAMLAQ